MPRRRSVEKEINEFLDVWNYDQMMRFWKHVYEIFELYDVDEEDDWVKDRVGKDNVHTVRMIRTVYLVSKFATDHGRVLWKLSNDFPGLWRLIEKAGLQIEATDGQEDKEATERDKEAC